MFMEFFLYDFIQTTMNVCWVVTIVFGHMNAETQKDLFVVINHVIQQLHQQQQRLQQDDHTHIIHNMLRPKHTLTAIAIIFGHIPHRYQEMLTMINGLVHVQQVFIEVVKALA